MDTSFFFISLFRSQQRQQKHQCSLIQHLVCNECVCFVQKRLIVDRVNRYDNVRTNTVTLKPPIHRYLYVPYYLWIARDKSLSLSLSLFPCACVRLYIIDGMQRDSLFVCLPVSLSVGVFVIVVLLHLERLQRIHITHRHNSIFQMGSAFNSKYRYLSMEFSLDPSVYLHRLLRNLLIPIPKIVVEILNRLFL